MRQIVTVRFSHEREFTLPVAGETMAADEARRWLDNEFIANECEPLRASGKLLNADKLLVVASAVGLEGFERDPAWAADYARAALAILGRSMACVDVDSGAITF